MFQYVNISCIGVGLATVTGTLLFLVKLQIQKVYTKIIHFLKQTYWNLHHLISNIWINICSILTQ